MPTLVNSIVENEATTTESALPPPLSMPATGGKLEGNVTPYANLITEELQRARAASDGDQRPATAASAAAASAAARSVQAAKPKFRVVAVDENQVAPLLRPGAPGTAFPAETPPLTVNGSPAAATAANGVNGSRRGDVVEAPGAADGDGSGDPGALRRHDGGAPLSTLRPASAADNGGRRASLPPPPQTAQRLPAAGDGHRSNGVGGVGSGGSPRPMSGGGGSSAASASSGVPPASTAAPDAEPVTGVPDDQATVSSGVQQRIHYRKLREKTNSATIDTEPAGGGSSAVAASTGSARMDRLAVPTSSSHYNSLPAAGAGWSYPVLLTPVPATHRNISTLSLTLLLRDQRRKNLAMLARLFASRQKEKDLLDGQQQQQYQEVLADAKKKRRCHGVTVMHFVVGILFVTLIALVVTSIKVFAPQRNIYSSQPGFVFDKDTRLLTVHNSSGYPLLQIRTGVDLRGLPYNCSTADDLGSRRRCWKWSPSNVMLRVSVLNLSAELTCVGVAWVTTSVEPVLRDCIVLGSMQWYGGASSRSLPWSLNAASASAGDAGFGPWLYAPGGSIGWLTARSWISSSGAMVAASGYTPLYLSVNGGSSPNFCLSSWYGYERSSARVLNYTACIAATVPTVHRRLVESQRGAAVWTDGYVVREGQPSDDVGRSKVTDTTTTTTTSSTSAESRPTTSLPADIAPATAVVTIDQNDDAGHQWPASADSVPTSSDGDVTATEVPRSSVIAFSRTRWASSVVMRDPVWLVQAGLNGSAAAAQLQRIVSHGFAVGTFLVRDSVLSEADAVTSTVARVVATARQLNSTVPAFGLTVSAFVSVRSELFLDVAYQGLWTHTARSALPVLVRDPAADTGSVRVASLLVNSSSDAALERAERGVRDVISGARVASNGSSIALLYLRVAVAVADLDLDSYSPATQERLLAYPHWFARLGDNLSRSVASNMVVETTSSGESDNVGHFDGRPVVSSSPPLVLVDGATTGLAGYALPESVRRGSLADIVTHMVAASVAGDPPASIGPFTLLDAAGGGTDADVKRRYVLWLQLAAFAPVLQLDVAPWEYGSDVAELAKSILAYRDAEIVPRLRRLYEAFRLTGEPVYKPLWWNDSVAAAAKASKLGTEFYLEDLLVAPVLDQKPYRLIYFPTGFWLDQSDKLFIGPGTHNVTIDPKKLPCFVRKTTGIHETGIPEGEVGLRRRR